MCFITYVDEGVARLVLQSGPHELRGQPIVVDMAAPRDPQAPGKGYPAPGKGHPISAAPQVLPKRVSRAGRLFLTKVAQDVTKEDLSAYFGRFGVLDDIYVPPGGKYIAFVSFADEHSARSVLQ